MKNIKEASVADLQALGIPEKVALSIKAELGFIQMKTTRMRKIAENKA